MKDFYLYDDVDVLKNELNIKNDLKLKQAETSYILFAVDELLDKSITISSIYDCLLIHEYLFEGIYDWAGNPRTIDIYKSERILGGKSIDYVFASYILQALDKLNDEFKRIDFSQFNHRDKIEKICYFASEFWHIHPFREGNTRTSAMMLCILLKQNGLGINPFSFLSNSKRFRNALVLSSLYNSSKPEYLFEIVNDIVSPSDSLSR